MQRDRQGHQSYLNEGVRHEWMGEEEEDQVGGQWR